MKGKTFVFSLFRTVFTVFERGRLFYKLTLR